jgi:CTP:molybdopterin cytidylyltransferase MocA
VAATLPPGFTAEGVPGLRPLPLPCSGLDMLGSLRWGLRHLISDPGWNGVVVLPVDHPLVSVEAIGALRETEGPVVIPCYRGKHGHPILLRRDVAEGIAREKLPGDTVRDVLRNVGSVDVVVDDAGVISNCNTPDALKEALERANY